MSGFVTHIDPPFYDNIEPSAGIDALDFTLNFRGVVAATSEDQLYALTLNVIGDGDILLDTSTSSSVPGAILSSHLK